MECTLTFRDVFPTLFQNRTFMNVRAVISTKRASKYALAILLWEIFVGAEPWAGMRSAQIIAAVVGREERPGWPPSQAPEGIRTLICSLWSQNPFQRPTAEETLRIFDEVPSAPVS